MNLAQEITGPWTSRSTSRTGSRRAGNPNSVDGELSAYIRKTVLMPLNNGVSDDPGAVAMCPGAEPGVDPVGNNTWYYVHTFAVFSFARCMSREATSMSVPTHPAARPSP